MARPKIYEIDESYFELIDSDEKAYVLGFIYADGHVDSRNFDMAISDKDAEILNFIKKELKMGHPISNSSGYCRLSVSNKKISTDLIKLGIPSNKNNSLHLPKINKKFYPSFLLGLFDGDGHINGEECYFEISGGEQILKELKEFLKNILNINLSIRYRYSKENKNSCGLYVKGSLKVGKICEYFYKNNNLGLKRKKDKFFKVLEKSNIYKKRTFKYNGNMEKIKELFNLNYSSREISNKLELNYNSVRAIICKMRKGENVSGI